MTEKRILETIGILMIGRPKDMSRARAYSAGGALKAIVLHSVPHGGNLGRTLYHFLTGYAFHLGLFVSATDKTLDRVNCIF